MFGVATNFRCELCLNNKKTISKKRCDNSDFYVLPPEDPTVITDYRVEGCKNYKPFNEKDLFYMKEET